MKFICFVIISIIVLFFHEMGHYISAKLMNLTVEKISFSMRPLPRFYVSVIDKGIPFTKRMLYYMSGNLVTILLFIILNFIEFKGIRLVRLVVAIQIIIETNPFFSDYSTISFWLANKQKIDKLPQHIYNSTQEKDIASFLGHLRETYFLSPVWVIHFVIWTVCLIYLLKMFF